MKFPLTISLILVSSLATAAEDLANIIKCHEALDGKSEGQTQKLGFDSSTPIAYAPASNKNIYFMTDTSIYALENKFQDKDLLIHLNNNGKDFYRQMEIRKDGSIGVISYDEIKDTTTAVEPKASLDEETLSLYKKDLVRRVNSMKSEHQNKFDPQDTLTALKSCEDLKSVDMDKALVKQTAYYEDLLKKPKAYSQGLKKKTAKASE